METERYDIIEGPGRPSICLGMARGDWFTTCCTAQDFSLDITGQTRDIFDVFDRHMAEAGTDISKVLFVQFWLKTCRITTPSMPFGRTGSTLRIRRHDPVCGLIWRTQTL